MRGSTYKRSDGTWTAMGDYRDPLSGQRKRPSRSGFKTKRDADEWLRTFDAGDVDSSKETLLSYLTVWLEGLRLEVRPSTHDWYASTARTHILPKIGNVKLSNIGPDTLKALYGSVPAGAVKRVHKVMHRAFKDALVSGAITKSPMARVRPPKAAPLKRPPKFWTSEQLASFLEASASHRLYAAWRVLAMTGCRRGEVLGLEWSDISWSASTITFQRAITAKGRGPLKTAASYRTVDVDGETMALLKRHRKEQLQERLRLREIWRDENLVFTTEDGGAIDPRNFLRSFYGLARKARVPKIRLHEVRDSHASQLIIAGTHPKVVQERLGHSSMAMTLGLYAHVMPSMGKEAAALAASLVAKMLPSDEQETSEAP